LTRQTPGVRGAATGLIWRLGAGRTGAVLLYLTLALILVHGLLGAESSAWWTGSSDGSLRAVWLVNTLARDGLTGGRTALVFAPFGASWAELTDGELLPYGLLAVLVRELGGPRGYAIGLAAVLLLNALTARALARQVDPCAGAATAVGALTMLLPPVLARLSDGDLAVAFLFLPLAATSAMLRGIGRSSPRAMALAGLLVGLSYGVCWQWSLVLLPVFALASILHAATGRKGALAVAPGLAIAGVVVWSLHAQGLGLAVSDWAPGPPTVAGAGSRLLLRYLEGPGRGFVASSLVGEGALGLLPLGLALPALLALTRRHLVAWVGVTLLALLALGPGIQVGLNVLPLPYLLLLETIPVLARVAEPARWALLLVVPLVPLAAGGIGLIVRSSALRPAMRAAVGLLGVLVALGLGLRARAVPAPSKDLQGQPYPTTAPTLGGAAIVLPINREQPSLSWQIQHPEEAVVAGPARTWMNLAPTEWISYAEQNTALRCFLGWTALPAPVAGNDLLDLKSRGVDRVIVDQTLQPTSLMPGEQSILDNLPNLVSGVAYRDETLAIYALAGNL